MHTGSDTLVTHTPTEHDLDVDELDRAHETFLAEIVYLDDKAVQRLFKTIAEDDVDAALALSGEK